MELLSNFANGSEVGRALWLPLANTVRHLPNPLTLPINHVEASDHRGDHITCVAFLRLESFAGTYDEAWNLAATCVQYALACGATEVGPVTIDYARLESGPVYADYGKPGVFRFISNYRLAYRRS